MTRAGRSRWSALGFCLATLIAIIMSGAPQALSVALDADDCCETECGGSLGSKGCGPTCNQGSCAKSFATTLDRGAPALVAMVGVDLHTTTVEPILSPLMNGIFHPPRA
jgi:hypothetical protein